MANAVFLNDTPDVEVSINGGCKVLVNIAQQCLGTPMVLSSRPSKIYLLKSTRKH